MAAFLSAVNPLGKKKWGFSETCVANPLLHALLPCSNILWLKRLWHAEESHSHQHHKPSELIAKQAARKEERKSSQKIFYVNQWIWRHKNATVLRARAPPARRKFFSEGGVSCLPPLRQPTEIFKHMDLHEWLDPTFFSRRW